MTYAESKQINVVLEMLNSRDSSHPMKGHPGYFGDDIDRCIDMIKAVDSPRMKLLFDVYHVQIMNGDPIRRFQENSDYISHVHTAGQPRAMRIGFSPGVELPANHQGHPCDWLLRLHCPGIHPYPGMIN